MKPTTSREVHKALAERLAARKVPDEVIAKIADRLTVDDLKIGGIDVCPYGICIDYWSQKPISVEAIAARGRFRGLRLFPWGIIDPDLFRVQVEMRVPELDAFAGR